MLKHSLIAAPVLVLAACGHAGHHGAGHGPAHMSHAPAASSAGLKAFATILNADGLEIGNASFEQGAAGLLIRVETGPGTLTPGWHGIHLHETGDCSDTGSFQLSGGHHGKTAGGHGLMNEAGGPEAGDLPNLWAAADGAAGYEAFTVLTDLGAALDSDGLAIIVHASVDDHRTQPIGGAGARVACGAAVRSAP